MDLNRRTFIKTAATGFGSILLMPSCAGIRSSFHFFSEEEARCLVALCEQIIPADAFGGGATEAGVIHYIDRQLVAVFDYDQLLYQKGLAALQKSCLDRYGRRFEALDRDTQVQLLESIDRGELSGPEWEGFEPGRFFNRVIDHTMQGFYGPPRHGGNRNYMSYQMMGLDFPLVIGRNHYEQGEG